MKKKNVFLLVVLVMIFSVGFAQESKNIQDSLLSEVLSKFGSDYTEILQKNGKPIKEEEYLGPFDMKYKKVIYPGFQIDLENGKQFVTLELFDPKLELVSGISTGIHINNVIKKLGINYSKSDNDTKYTYRKWPPFYRVIFYVDSNNKVIEIEFYNDTGLL